MNDVKDRLERALARLEGAVQGRLARRPPQATMTEVDAARKQAESLEHAVREASQRLDAVIGRIRAVSKE